jgi:cell division protein FtsX
MITIRGRFILRPASDPFFQLWNFMNQQSATSSKNFPIDNLVYDLMMIIAKKSKGLKAMEQYLQDAQNNQRVKDTFEKIRKHDEECVRELTQHLGFLIGQQKAAGG